MPKIEGSCHCGSIRYSCSSEPKFTAICNCSSCQKSTGSAFSVVIGLNKPDFTVTGGCLTKYEYLGDSGKPLLRHFCSRCGTALYADMTSSPNTVVIGAGTLHDNSWVKPQMHVYWRDHCSLLSDLHTIPKFNILPGSK